MRAPIIVLADDVDLFVRIEEAERYLESPDVRSGNVREIYDRDGRRLRPVIVRTVLGAERLKIEDTSETANPERFRDAVVQLLVRSTKESPDVFRNNSVEELITKALPYITR